jgi:PAS domain S-box-containing protein
MSGQLDYSNKLSDTDAGWDTVADKIHDFYPAIVYTYDIKQQRIKFLNRKVSDLLGYSADTGGLPDSLLKIVFSEDAPIVETALEKFCSLAEGTSHAYDARLNHKEGTWRYFRTTGNVVKRDDQGVPSVVLCIAQEVTDQLKSQEEIRTTRELIEGTESLLQFGSWSWDVQTWDLVATDGLFRLLGYTQDEVPKLTGDFYLSHVIEEQRGKLREIILQSIASASAFEFEYVMLGCPPGFSESHAM